MTSLPPQADPPPVTCVLLSTYNGARFLPEQLASLLDQTHRPDILILRDDGSIDGTVAIAERMLMGRGIRLILHRGQNIGPERSFRALMRLGLETGAGLFFLCDQDDIWNPDKIGTFLEQSVSGPPQLLFSRYLLVDAANTALGLSQPPGRIGFGNAVLQNIVTGCTAACNRACLEIAAGAELDPPVMHDRWLYLIAAAFGQVRFIEQPTIRYRQHGANVVGAETTFWRIFRRRMRRVMAGKPRTQLDSIRQILMHHGDRLSPEDAALCRDLLAVRHSYRARLRLILSRRCWRQRLSDEILWRGLILLGRV